MHPNHGCPPALVPLFDRIRSFNPDTASLNTAKQTGRDLTEGSIPRHLLSLALPMLIGNLIHTGYGIIDMIWIGRFVGPDAVGAIAVGFPI